MLYCEFLQSSVLFEGEIKNADETRVREEGVEVEKWYLFVLCGTYLFSVILV